MNSIDASPFFSLEEQFESAITQPVDVRTDCGFKDYLDPNEGSPEGIKPHLELAERGDLVSTGTERCFFNLCFLDEGKCTGLIVRDINPRVKAYVDFNTLLLRLAETREEYVELSTLRKPSPGNLHVHLERIKALTEGSELPGRIKEYYLKHLEDFGHVYYQMSSKFWRSVDSNYFTKCRYDENDFLFLKVQKYAKSGNIISTIGDMNDLNFLKTRNISVIDTSNIHGYCTIDFQGLGNSHPRIIWTQPDARKTSYCSYVHERLEDEEQVEFQQLMKKMKDCGVHENTLMSLIAEKTTCEKFSSSVGRFCSKRMLAELQKYADQNVLEIPNFPPLCITSFHVDKINTISKEHLQALSVSENTQRFLQKLTTYWGTLTSSTYLAFSQSEGWHEHFEEVFLEPDSDLAGFIKKLKRNKLFPTFLQTFGQERLENLQAKLKAKSYIIF
jgi:hypothetical protein